MRKKLSLKKYTQNGASRRGMVDLATVMKNQLFLLQSDGNIAGNRNQKQWVGGGTFVTITGYSPTDEIFKIKSTGLRPPLENVDFDTHPVKFESEAPNNSDWKAEQWGTKPGSTPWGWREGDVQWARPAALLYPNELGVKSILDTYTMRFPKTMKDIIGVCRCGNLVTSSQNSMRRAAKHWHAKCDQYDKLGIDLAPHGSVVNPISISPDNSSSGAAPPPVKLHSLETIAKMTPDKKNKYFQSLSKSQLEEIIKQTKSLTWIPPDHPEYGKGVYSVAQFAKVSLRQITDKEAVNALPSYDDDDDIQLVSSGASGKQITILGKKKRLSLKKKTQK